MTLFPAVLLGMGALVLDLGAVAVERAVLRNGADAAALAIVNDCLKGDCGNVWATAQTMADQNADDGMSAVEEVCGLGPGLLECAVSPNLPPNLHGYVRVVLRTLEAKTGSDRLNFTLARALGFSGTTVRQKAVLGWGPPAANDTLPLVFSRCEYLKGTAFAPIPQAPPLGTTPQTVYFHDTLEASRCPAGASGADIPGGFGWIADSRNCYVQADAGAWIKDNTGASVPSGCDPTRWVNRIMLLPVYDGLTGTGSNGKYHIYGFTGFYITGYRFPGTGNEYPAGFQCPGSQNQTCIQGYFVKYSLSNINQFGAENLGTMVVRFLDDNVSGSYQPPPVTTGTCSVLSTAASPSLVSASATGTLSSEVTVTAYTAGSCTGLAYRVAENQTATGLLSGSNYLLSAKIAAGTTGWTNGSQTVEFVQSGQVLGTADFTVEQGSTQQTTTVACTVVAVAVTPDWTMWDGAKLGNDLSIEAETAGACPPLTYKVLENTSVSGSLVQSGSFWQGWISKTTPGWTAKTYAVGVFSGTTQLRTAWFTVHPTATTTTSTPCTVSSVGVSPTSVGHTLGALNGDVLVSANTAGNCSNLSYRVLENPAVGGTLGQDWSTWKATILKGSKGWFAGMFSVGVFQGTTQLGSGSFSVTGTACVATAVTPNPSTVRESSNDLAVDVALSVTVNGTCGSLTWAITKWSAANGPLSGTGSTRTGTIGRLQASYTKGTYVVVIREGTTQVGSGTLVIGSETIYTGPTTTTTSSTTTTIPCSVSAASISPSWVQVDGKGNLKTQPTLTATASGQCDSLTYRVAQLPISGTMTVSGSTWTALVQRGGWSPGTYTIGVFQGTTGLGNVTLEVVSSTVTTTTSTTTTTTTTTTPPTTTTTTPSQCAVTSVTPSPPQVREGGNDLEVDVTLTVETNGLCGSMSWAITKWATANGALSGTGATRTGTIGRVQASYTKGTYTIVVKEGTTEVATGTLVISDKTLYCVATPTFNPTQVNETGNVLDVDVAITVTTTGTCGSLTWSISNFPTSNGPLSGAGSILTGCMGKTQAVWKAGTYTVLILDGITQVGSATFKIT